MAIFGLFLAASSPSYGDIFSDFYITNPGRPRAPRSSFSQFFKTVDFTSVQVYLFSGGFVWLLLTILEGRASRGGLKGQKLLFLSLFEASRIQFGGANFSGPILKGYYVDFISETLKNRFFGFVVRTVPEHSWGPVKM